MFLECECDICKGTGKAKYKVSRMHWEGKGPDYYPKCSQCDGRGKVLTNEGKEILDTLKYYLIEDRIFEPYKENEE